MGDLTLVRWTRFGKDRFYVKDADGNDLGWVDVATGAVTTSRSDLEQHIAEAVHTQLHGRPGATTPNAQPPSAVAATLSEEPGDSDVPAHLVEASRQNAEPEWHDLAVNRPGQAARAQAELALAAMKDRSRVGTWLARAVDAKTDERAWRVGADGEETIGAKLEKLTKDGWRILHAVPVGTRGSDIDHVVIGPGGVFTVNTKKHPGKKVWVGGDTIMIDGHRVPYVRNSEHEADRAERLLTAAVGFPVFVKPVLVFTTGTLFPDVTIKAPPKRVSVIDRMDVPRVFRRADLRLAAEQIELIYAVARRSTTWQG